MSRVFYEEALISALSFKYMGHKWFCRSQEFWYFQHNIISRWSHFSNKTKIWYLLFQSSTFEEVYKWYKLFLLNVNLCFDKRRFGLLKPPTTLRIQYSTCCALIAVVVFCVYKPCI